MKSLLYFAVCTLACVFAQASELSDKLQSHDYVLLMRHTRAPGVGDPSGYTLADCKTQRNLSAEGRKQAIVIGQWLRKQDVKKADVRTSAWCRCKDTAALLKFDGFQIEPSLNSFFDDMGKANDVTQQLQQFIALNLKTKGNQALILVSHHVNIHAFMGENIDSGDMVLAKVDSQGKMINYTLIPRPDKH